MEAEAGTRYNTRGGSSSRVAVETRWQSRARRPPMFRRESIPPSTAGGTLPGTEGGAFRRQVALEPLP